mmetsp:Transcript_830/g.845  ORF Transcript_830/g.845 Transcript_830/m.845 type:complete len:463 (-) Transcript_830:38-1426(-)|eukprot:CAMPEP_0182428310 /NCGR_PEP_ID=MMETSP1167-20130531/22205_1 /TAXON_ID=2988 /ORGANISM="Mallomonas Sp, Strain CCMP3275" /LENGTH=462 /DNA_ID=CAMNT_0024611119 /DNA_START=68 /DNA_END=1456 /DNA_ORIENTATION=+
MNRARHSQPPGGHQTFSFGSEPPTTPTKAAASQQHQQTPPPPPPHSTGKPCPVKIAIAIVKGIGSDLVLEATKSALSKHGLHNIPVTQVIDAVMIPSTTKKLLSTYDIVISLALITHDAVGSGSLVQTLLSSLLQIESLSSGHIVPGLFSPHGLLEAKTLLPTLSTKWASITAHYIEEEHGVKLSSSSSASSSLSTNTVGKSVTNPSVLITAFRASLKEHGAKGIFGLARKFRIITDNNPATHQNQISVTEFSRVVAEHGLNWTPAQIKSVFDYFDTDKSGSISYQEFLRGARGNMSSERKQFVLMAFQILDTDKSGTISLQEIKSKYDASKHPDVRRGIKSEDEILMEFLHTFDGHEDHGMAGHSSGEVRFSEFCEYYNNISVSIDNDDYWELMIRNAWHISGGHGWSENTTCRRVLVVHSDGRETVEEIKNDLGIGNDIEKLTSQLKKQGINDISRIETS